MLPEPHLLQFPHSRPMPVVGKQCHELRVVDENASWRLIYRLEPDAVVVLDVFRKTTQQTPLRVIATCQGRLRSYEVAAMED